MNPKWITLIIIFVLCLLFAGNLSGANDSKNDPYPGKPAQDTIELADTNFYTMDFAAFHGSILEAVNPMNGQMDIGPVNGASGIAVSFDNSGSIKGLEINLRATIMETDKEYVMGEYVIANTPDSPGVLSVRMMKNFAAAKADFEESFDFRRFERLSNWLTVFDLQKFIEAEFPGRGLAPANFQFSADNPTREDLSNSGTTEIFFRMTADGIEPANPEDFQSGEPGYYTIASYNEKHEAGSPIVVLISS